jgi:alkanesulfonate monooxygenase SsuD/methylene tetrahydromethanopterin reductase-like flavin-dependent oxidoreductase (luciferase family)
MQFGVGFFTAQRPPTDERSDADLYQELIQDARRVEQAGLDSFWLSEHHVAEDGYMPSILPASAAVAAATQRIRIGTGVIIASFYHPLRLAEDLITLDLISKGRFVAGIGLGYRPEEYDAFGITHDDDRPLLEEALAVLRLAFAGKPFTYEGRYHTIPELTVTPRPYTDGGPPIMLAGNSVADLDAQRAGEAGTRYMIDPAISWDEVIRLTDIYERARSSDGEIELPIFCYGFVREDGDAWEGMRTGFSYLRDVYDDWQVKPRQTVRDPADYRLLLGNVDQVCEQADQYRRQFGDRAHLILRLNYPGMPSDAVAEAISLWGRVADALR